MVFDCRGQVNRDVRVVRVVSVEGQPRVLFTQNPSNASAVLTSDVPLVSCLEVWNVRRIVGQTLMQSCDDTISPLSPADIN